MSASSAAPAMQARMTDERTAAAAQSSVAFSRPTLNPMHGKQTCTLKTSVTDEVAEDFKRFARERGYGSDSDCLREIVMASLYGRDWLVDLHRRRIESLSPNGAGIGTGVAP